MSASYIRQMPHNARAFSNVKIIRESHFVLLCCFIERSTVWDLSDARACTGVQSFLGCCFTDAIKQNMTWNVLPKNYGSRPKSVIMFRFFYIVWSIALLKFNSIRPTQCNKGSGKSFTGWETCVSYRTPKFLESLCAFWWDWAVHSC